MAGVTLGQLNNFMKNLQTELIINPEYWWSTLESAFSKNLKGTGFIGDLAEMLIQTGNPYSGQAFGENVDIPYAGEVGFVKQYIPLKEIIVNAGVTQQMLDRATGGNASWGNAVDMVLEAERNEFKWLRELCAIGDGTGRLARVASASEGLDNSAGTGYTAIGVSCDNTYLDFGWENVALLKPGMWVEVWKNDGTLYTEATTGTTKFEVYSVAFGDRANGAATTGVVTLKALNDTSHGSVGKAFDLYSALAHGTHGAALYLARTRSLGLTDSVSGTVCYQAANVITGTTADVSCSLPMGLTGLIQDAVGHPYVDSGTHHDYTLDTFQGLARASYSTMNSHIYDAADLVTGGTPGVPEDWSLSQISSVVRTVEKDPGAKIDLMLCSSELAGAIDNKNRAFNNAGWQVGNPSSLMGADAAGTGTATWFLGPNGTRIPVVVSATIPKNCLYGLCTRDFTLFKKGEFDFKRINGQIWDKSYADRKINFEAPFGGYSQIGAQRVDRCFLMRDMRDDV